jgi:pSer/pThr/pTyr-binding forkhead associated (FHA) protein
MICPDCGHNNRIGVQLCENCGADLYDSLLEMVATKQLSKADTREIEGIPDDSSPSSNPIVVYISNDKNPLAIERLPNLIVGRIDPNDDSVKVDVDLEPYDAQDLGVSRQHARLFASSHKPILVDLGSYNGTFINGQQLTPSQDYEVKSGDEIRMGRLVMRFYFK